MKRYAYILSSLFLLIWLPSCGPTTKTMTVLLEPPDDLIQPCVVDDPRPVDPTTEDIIASRRAYQDALAACDEDKTGLRVWLERQRELHERT